MKLTRSKTASSLVNSSDQLSLYYLPLEILSSIIDYSPNLAFTSTSLYKLGLRRLYNKISSNGVKPLNGRDNYPKMKVSRSF